MRQGSWQASASALSSRALWRLSPTLSSPIGITTELFAFFTLIASLGYRSMSCECVQGPPRWLQASCANFCRPHPQGQMNSRGIHDVKTPDFGVILGFREGPSVSWGCRSRNPECVPGGGAGPHPPGDCKPAVPTSVDHIPIFKLFFLRVICALVLFFMYFVLWRSLAFLFFLYFVLGFKSDSHWRRGIQGVKPLTSKRLED
jgi:hypothetical protein